MTMRLACGLLLALVPSVALAEPVRVVEHPRMRLGEVVPGVPAECADVDLGPSPPAGASRLIARDELAARVRDAGLATTKLPLPRVVRVVAASKRIDRAEVARVARSVIAAELPNGVSISRVEAARDVVAPPCATAERAKLPRPPKREGLFRTTAVLEWVCEGEVIARTPLSVQLDVDAEAAKPTIPRGARLRVVLERGNVRITAEAIALGAASEGERLRAQIASTGRVLEATVLSRDEAVVDAAP